MIDVSFDCMGTEVRLLVRAGDAPAAREFLHRFDHALSRFRPDSQLSRLNADPRATVPASQLLQAAVAAARAAAQFTNGLVDPTLLPQLEAAGYDRTRREPEIALATALAAAPERSPATPNPGQPWRHLALVDHAVRRPPGLRVDTGGTGKGLAADLLATDLQPPYALDIGGDIRVSGRHTVHVRHPLTHDTAHTFTIEDQAIATSGLDTRLWRAVDGTPRHHLLDPSTGRPAWTGLISATALAPTALEAETRAKAALLSGPAHARKWLKRHGGLTIADDGSIHVTA